MVVVAALIWVTLVVELLALGVVVRVVRMVRVSRVAVCLSL